MLSKGAKWTIFYNNTVSLQFFFVIKRLHGVKTCIEMFQVYSVWSLNVLATQTLQYKISLFEFPLLRYSIPQVWIDNSYQANPGNSCSHAHFFVIKRLHGVKTCIEMFQVYSVWSLNVSETQTLQYKISLFEFPLLRYSIPQVWIDNSYQANPGNSCSHAHFFSARGTKITGLQGQHATLPRPYTRPAEQIFTIGCI